MDTCKTNKKAFICDVCKKSYTKKSSLKAHKRTHLNINPFKCDVCDKSFSQKGYHKTHMLVHCIVVKKISNVVFVTNFLQEKEI